MKYIAMLLLLLSASAVPAQDTIQMYFPKMDAVKQTNDAAIRAKAEGKHVLLMIGGNWCRWCKMFDRMLMNNHSVDSALKANYIFEHINFSKENRNLDLMTLLDFPQRFGFPVFVVIDSNGDRIHTQNSAYLEEGEGYNAKKVIEFFEQWGPAALKKEQYNE